MSNKSLLQYLPLALVMIAGIIAFTRLQDKADALASRVGGVEADQAVVLEMRTDLATVKNDVAWIKQVFEKYDIVVQK